MLPSTGMAALGAGIVPIDFTPFAEAASMLYAGPWVAERLVAIGDLADAKPRGDPRGRARHHPRREEKTAAETFKAFYDLAELMREARGRVGEDGLLLLPTAGTTYTIAEMLADPVALNTNLGAYTNFVNLMDLAALAVPAGFRPDGIPFGVTLIGPALSDGMLAVVGDALHRRSTARSLGATSISLSSTPPVTLTREASDVGQSGRRRRASVRPAAQLATCRTQGKLLETTRTGAWLSALCPCRHLAAKPGLVFDGTGAGGYRGRNLGDGARAPSGRSSP